MRMVMMGTGPFAVPTYRGLYEAGYEVIALVTQPLKRGREPGEPLNPMRDLAHEQGAPIYDPPDINMAEAQGHLATYDADLLVVCDYGQILSADTLATARLGGINLHGSLLPKYRGAAPINWALYYGEKVTGVSVIHMTPRVDAGPLIGQAETVIQPEETAVELEVRLADLGAWLIRRTIDALEAGRLEALPQDPAQASKAPRLKKTDGLVDWRRPAEAIRNHYRALQPWPKTHSFWHRGDGPPLRLIVGPLVAVPSPGPQAPPGTVLEASKDRLVIAAGEGAVLIEGVQPAGKRFLDARAFLNGHRVRVGDRFGAEVESTV
jgi:methionyl-tRNA formyltransferase